MQIKIINRRAQKKFEAYMSSITDVTFALQNAQKLVKNHDIVVTEASWLVPGRDELTAAISKAKQDTQGLVAASRKVEAELISRDWRK